MERGLDLLELTMSDIQVRAAVNAQKAASKKDKLTYRGVAYLKQNWAALAEALYPCQCGYDSAYAYDRSTAPCKTRRTV